MILRAEAPAKINRELRVGSLRPDGFHEIRSRIVSIDLSDRIEVEKGSGTLEFLCRGEDVPRDETNLAVRAARRLADRLAIAPDARIRLEKRIPSGTGLGGGSADAAVTLSLLAQLWQARLTLGELDDMASDLGSDVPFFLVGGEADVSGRGERVTPRADGPAADLLLLVPPFSLSTGEVYAAHRRLYPDGAAIPEKLQIETSGKYLGPNDLASAVLEIKREMSSFLDSARQAASEFTISGSGSALVLFGVGEEEEERLRERQPHATFFRCRTLSREHYRHRIHSSGGFDGHHAG